MFSYHMYHTPIQSDETSLNILYRNCGQKTMEESAFAEKLEPILFLATK
jgi:hypothetical protein